MKKLPISKFDLGMIIAFVVVGLLGGGAWYYLSTQLAAAQNEVTSAKSEFDRYSSFQGSKQKFLVRRATLNVIQDNIKLLQGQIDPIIETKFLAKGSNVASSEKKDPVAWKHYLDDKVRELTKAAGVHGVTLPKNFYFTFSRYVNQNPGDEQTDVLSKQLLAVDKISTILINAPVKGIVSIRRTYEENAPTSGMPSMGGPQSNEPDRMGGFSVLAPDGSYRSYPFDVEFDATPAGLRDVMDNLLKSPYILVVRTLAVHSSGVVSPQPADLDKMAGSTDNSVTDKPPGEAAATVSTKGPQFLFGSAVLRVKARIDLIEWLAPAPGASDSSSPGGKK